MRERESRQDFLRTNLDCVFLCSNFWFEVCGVCELRRQEGFSSGTKTPESREDEFGESAPIGPVQKATGGGRGGGVGERKELGDIAELAVDGVWFRRR